MTLKEIQEFITNEFPQTEVTVESVGEMSCVVRHKIGKAQLRPGGTVSGPVMMATADVAIYVSIFNEIGKTPLAVTTNLNINFLRKPSSNSDILGKCKILKFGKRLVIGEVTIYSEGNKKPAAHATVTYSIPPEN